MSTTALDFPKGVTIFGREPASILSGVEAILTLLITFGIGARLGISQEVYAPIIALISAGMGIYIAHATKDTGLAYYLGGVKAVVALVVAYGFTVTDAQMGALLAAVTIGIGLFNRQATSPVAAPADPSPQQVTPVPATPDVVADVKATQEASVDDVKAAADTVVTGSATGAPEEGVIDPANDPWGSDWTDTGEEKPV